MILQLETAFPGYLPCHPFRAIALQIRDYVWCWSPPAYLITLLGCTQPERLSADHDIACLGFYRSNDLRMHMGFGKSWGMTCGVAVVCGWGRGSRYVRSAHLVYPYGLHAGKTD